MEKSDFDALMERYLRDQVSEEEKIKIEAWLEVMKTEETTDLELSAADEKKLFQKITDRTTLVDEVVKIIPARKGGFLDSSQVVRIAAAVAALALVSYAVWFFAFSPANSLQVISKNGTEKIILNDGSICWLKPSSKFLYFQKLDEGIRYGELEGESLFEIAKDASHPFIIQCGEVTIKVVGTSFNVKASLDRVELSVLTGKVSVSSKSNTEGVIVAPNERIIWKKTGEFEKLPLEMQQVSLLTHNTEYDMTFPNQELSEVFARLASKFNVKIIVESAQISRCRITADLTDHSLENSLQRIAEVLDIKYSQQGKEIHVSGPGCK